MVHSSADTILYIQSLHSQNKVEHKGNICVCGSPRCKSNIIILFKGCSTEHLLRVRFTRAMYFGSCSMYEPCPNDKILHYSLP